MNFDTFLTRVKQLIADEITAWSKGEIQWNVSNQFDETILESAFDNLSYNVEAQYKCYARFNASLPNNIIDIAHMASTFEVEPLADAWTQ